MCSYKVILFTAMFVMTRTVQPLTKNETLINRIDYYYNHSAIYNASLVSKCNILLSSPDVDDEYFMCSAYYCMIPQTVTKFETNDPEVVEKLNSTYICNTLSNYYSEKKDTSCLTEEYLKFRNSIQNISSCERICVSSFDKKINPICKLLFKGAKYLKEMLINNKHTALLGEPKNVKISNISLSTTPKPTSIKLQSPSNTPIVNTSKLLKTPQETQRSPVTVTVKPEKPVTKEPEDGSYTETEKPIQITVANKLSQHSTTKIVTTDIQATIKQIEMPENNPELISRNTNNDADDQSYSFDNTDDDQDQPLDLDTKRSEITYTKDNFKDTEDSHFFIYLLLAMLMCVLGYVGFHKKQKILALLLEGRRSNSSSRNGRKRHTAAYRKLDSNLEEAVTSCGSSNVTQVIY